LNVFLESPFTSLIKYFQKCLIVFDFKYIVTGTTAIAGKGRGKSDTPQIRSVKPMLTDRSKLKLRADVFIEIEGRFRALAAPHLHGNIPDSDIINTMSHYTLELI